MGVFDFQNLDVALLQKILSCYLIVCESLQPELHVPLLLQSVAARMSDVSIRCLSVTCRKVGEMQAFFVDLLLHMILQCSWNKPVTGMFSLSLLCVFISLFFLNLVVFVSNSLLATLLRLAFGHMTHISHYLQGPFTLRMMHTK